MKKTVRLLCLSVLSAIAFISQAVAQPVLVTNGPTAGTFYLLSVNPSLPYPFDPYFGVLPVYSYDGVYFVDDSQVGDLQLQQNGFGGEMTMNSLSGPGPGVGGTNNSGPATNICSGPTNFTVTYERSTTNTPPYGTNDLWLSIQIDTNNVANLIIHTPNTNSFYDVFGTTNLSPYVLPLNQTNWTWLQRASGAATNFLWTNITPCEAWFELGTMWDDDEDGLTTAYENLVAKTSATESDTDGDGLSDRYELTTTHTDPNNPDTGSAGIPDGYKDPDGDGWTHIDEARNGTNPLQFNTPQSVSNFLPRAATNQTAILSWDPSPGTVIGYSIQKYSYFTHSYEEIGTTSSNVYSFTDSGPSPVWDSIIYSPLTYRIQAVYSGGLSAPVYSALEPDQAAYTVAASLVRGGDGYWKVALSVPGGVETVRICWVEWDYWMDLPSTVSTYDILTNQIVNGYYSISNAEAVDHMTDVLYVRGVGPEGLTGYPTFAGNPYADAPYFVDGSRQLKENLPFMLRSGSQQRFHFLIEQFDEPDWGWFNTNGSFASSSFMHPDLGPEKGYGSTYFPFVALDNLWPFYVNNLFRQQVYGESVPGFEWFPDFSAGSLPPYLTNNPYFVVLRNGELADYGLNVSSNAVFLTNGLKNHFGLSFQDAVVRSNSESALLSPGNSFYFIPSFGLDLHVFGSTVAPVLQTVGYYFAPVSTPGTLVIGPSTWVSEQTYKSPLNLDFSVTNQTPLMIGSVGERIVIGGWAKQRITNGDTNKFAYLGQYFDRAYKADVNGTATTNETGVLSPYGEFFPTEPGRTILKTKPDIETSELGQAFLNVISLNVDANHDGVMDLTFGGLDRTSAQRRFVFWVNNDFDRGHNVDCDFLGANCDWEEDDLKTGGSLGTSSVTTPDYAYAHYAPFQNPAPLIPSVRDLEDYARLWLSGLSNVMALMPTNYTAKLVLSGDAEIRIFRAYEAAGGTNYLFDEIVASNQVANSESLYLGLLTSASPVTLSGQTNRGEHFIFCGAKRGTADISLQVLKGEQILATTAMHIELNDIKEMYERWTVGDAPKMAPMILATNASEGLPAGVPAFRYSHNGGSDTNLPYLLYVHGWNLEQWEKDRFAEAAFKRLYWQGYQGRFGVFRWPTYNKFGDLGESWNNPITDSLNYDKSEFNAWRSAEGLRRKLVNLNGKYPGHVYVLAHSMGNVVAGEALRLAGNSQLVNTYVASQAAVPAHVYDAGVTNPFLINFIYDHPSLPGGTHNYGPDTPNIYGNWLAGNSAAVGRRVNFFNTNDYALQTPRWEFNQIVKPDEGAGFDIFNYFFDGFPYDLTENYTQGNPDDNSPWNHFGKNNAIIDIVTNIVGRYEIMAFAAEARSRALGRTPSVATLDGNLNLADVWATDPQNNVPDQFSRHKWHSAQFRSTIMKQQNYWRQLLGNQGFDIQ
jgi:hypothetical protein